MAATINYAVDTGRMESFHANDHSRDTVRLDPRLVEITDARGLRPAPTLDRNGFQLCEFPSSVTDWRDVAEPATVHPAEVQAFIRKLTGADEVVIAGPPILRFGERSAEAGTRDNSNAARLVHSDTAIATANGQTRDANPQPDRAIRRSAHYNVWRAFSGSPVDVPLTVCDWSSVSEEDIIEATAAFDRDGAMVWSFTAMTFRFSPAHRWYYFSNMQPDEVIVFKRFDTDPDMPRFLPHTAFSDPTVPPDVPPRASVEMRAIAYWYR
ncbi:MAG: CmcJ/NvfI family oxidoreductase [Novosphingobium sp.]